MLELGWPGSKTLMWRLVNDRDLVQGRRGHHNSNQLGDGRGRGESDLEQTRMLAGQMPSWPLFSVG